MQLMIFVAMLISAVFRCGTALAATTFKIAKPGVLLVDPEHQTIKSTFCRVKNVSYPQFEPIIILNKYPKGYGSDTRTEPMAFTIMQLTGEYLNSKSPSLTKYMLNTFYALATNEALQHDRSHNSVFSVSRSLLPLITTWAIIRKQANENEQQTIDGWFARRVASLDVKFNSQVDKKNLRFLVCANMMAWSVIQNLDAKFNASIACYKMALDQMRSDGSFPLETKRGARALWYQRQAISTLTYMAAIAKQQGYDIFTDRGKSLHSAVEFLINEISVPNKILQYAKENFAPGPSLDWSKQDLGFLTKRGHGRHYMAWIEPYMHYFPDHPNSQRLRSLDNGGILKDRPLIDEFIGGNASCMFESK